MKRLWDFPEELHSKPVALALSKYGTLVNELSSPHSSLFTFDLGPQTHPRYIVAKGIRFSTAMPVDEQWKHVRRALDEVSNAYAVCHHPSIQRFFDIQIVYGVPFLLSRKRDATLCDVIARGPLTETEALSIALQIVHALSYCENRGLLCHQDLKPENIFVDSIPDRFDVPQDYPLQYWTFIADFELANAYRVLRHPFGSRPYMAPEQYERVTDDKPLPDFSRVDVFALGVMLCEMLTGGIHPLGEHTRLIWPNPAGGKSRKWMRDTPWKQWLARGATLDPACASRLDPQMISLIQDCLQLEIGARPSKEDVEAHLRQHLNSIDADAYNALRAMLSDFDPSARDGEEGGWPYYAQRMDSLNEAFSDRTQL